MFENISANKYFFLRPRIPLYRAHLPQYPSLSVGRDASTVRAPSKRVHHVATPAPQQELLVAEAMPARNASA